MSLLKDGLLQGAWVWLGLTLAPFMSVNEVLQFYGVLFPSLSNGAQIPP